MGLAPTPLSSDMSMQSTAIEGFQSNRGHSSQMSGFRMKNEFSLIVETLISAKAQNLNP